MEDNGGLLDQYIKRFGRARILNRTKDTDPETTEASPLPKKEAATEKEEEN